MANTHTLKVIVYQVLNDLGNYSLHNYRRYLQWAYRGLDKLHMRYIDSISYEYGTVDANNVYDLPDDYMHYSKIGVVVDGKIETLSLNKDIALVKPDGAGDYTYNSDLQDALKIAIGTWLAVPQTIYNMAKVRVDTTTTPNRLIFEGDMVGEEIVIEYNGSDVSEVSVVPKYASEALIAWVHWQRAKNDKEVWKVEREDRRRTWLHEVREVVKYESQFTYDELTDVINSGGSQLAKR